MQFKRYYLSGAAQFVSAYAGERIVRTPPTLVSTRAHVVNVATGQVYYVKNANVTDTIPASITKMMTCYTLLQHKTYAELENTVTVLAGDIQGGSGNNLLAGDVISYRQLIADAMLPSSNTACAVIARVIGQQLLDVESSGVGSSFNRFMTEMNNVSDAIGMVESTWYNPSGLNGPDYSPPTSTNITSPVDMNRVMGLLWAYPVMAEIWAGGVQFVDMPLVRGGSSITIQIENVVGLRADAGVVFGKNGTTTVANSCAVWQAASGDQIAVTVFNGGSTGRYTDSRAIFAQLPLDFPELSLAPEAASEHLITIANSQQVNTASPASIKQTHLITIANSQQVNTASDGSVTQSTTHYITVANSQQVNTASPAAIAQTHLITIADSQQVNTASPGSISSEVVVVGGPISDEDIARIVAAVLAALQATAIPVNIKQVNSEPIKGNGRAGNYWGPV